jgi:cytochrome c peroxidase
MVEAELFPRAELDSGRIASARRLVSYMRIALGPLRLAGTDTMRGDAYLFDAMRHEIARVVSLGLAGFDATVTHDGALESAEALEGIADALQPYRAVLGRGHPAVLRALDVRLAAAIAYLRTNGDFEQLDRASFIARFANPLAHALADAQRSLGIDAPPKPRAWSARAASLFDANALDPAFFASTDAPRPTPEIVTLGRELFFDRSLSGDGSRSCATCHVPERAFTDGRARALLLPGHGKVSSGRNGGPRNTPTLLNAGLQPTLFMDNRVRTLEDQATDVLGSPGEMGGSLKSAAETLRKRPELADLFARAFGGAKDTALSARTLRLALAAYVRSLVAMRSRFDRAIAGDLGAMSDEERRGFNVFMSKAKCGTCHFAPLFNGATPPVLWESEPEVIGAPRHAGSRRAEIDPDSGRFNVRRIDRHLYAFRAPTLRNVELTAPYMHNGVFRTLEEVVDFYDGGGGHGLGIALPQQTLPTDSLHLTSSEKRSLIAFLETLTDTAGTTRRP